MRPHNWNRIQDPIDKVVWDTLNKNLWQPEKVPVANDVPSWGRLTPQEKQLTIRIFTGLTMLDTLQSTIGAPALIPDAVTEMETANLANICYMEAIHHKSYSTIFSTLCSTQDIDEAFDWAENHQLLQAKAISMEDIYRHGAAAQKKIGSVFLESFMFYSGFFWPLYLAAHAKLPNTADMIRLIMRDESVHGYYIGYKAQPLSAEDKDYAYAVLDNLMDIELDYTQELYGELGLVGEVRAFLYYNANKALMNLGLDPLYAEDETQVNPLILSALSTASENHDFFSGSGSSYVVGKKVASSDEDWS